MNNITLVEWNKMHGILMITEIIKPQRYPYHSVGIWFPTQGILICSSEVIFAQDHQSYTKIAQATLIHLPPPQ